jgi:hypothetical protein
MTTVQLGRWHKLPCQLELAASEGAMVVQPEKVVSIGGLSVVGAEITDRSFSDSQLESCVTEAMLAVDSTPKTAADTSAGLRSVQPISDGAYRVEWPVRLIKQMAETPWAGPGGIRKPGR